MQLKTKNKIRRAKETALKTLRLTISALGGTAVIWLCAQLWKYLNSLL